MFCSSQCGKAIRSTVSTSAGATAIIDFIPETVQKLDFGDRHYYAAHTILDSQGRHIMWGFIGEGRSTEAQQAAGWSGVMALPRELALRDDGKLAIPSSAGD